MSALKSTPAGRPSGPVAQGAAALLLSGLGLLPLHASAQSHALGAKVGTSGPGIEYSYSSGVLPKYGLRANLNFGSYSRTHTVSSVEYRGSLNFRSLMLFADAHPFLNGFRLSAGLMLNNNKFSATGRPVAATFNVNGVTYPATAVDSVNGDLRFEPASPYFGIGWGAAPTGSSKYFFSFDFGVMYHRPDVRLNAACGATFPAAECTRLQSDLRAQEADFRRDLLEFRVYPILTFGAGYRF